MKVLHYHEGFYPASGGTEAYIRNLCQNLPCDFEVLSDLHDVSLGEETGIPHTRITRIGPRNTVTAFAPSLTNRRALYPYRLVTDWLRYHRTAEYLRKADCDLMHFHGTGAGASLTKFVLWTRAVRLLRPLPSRANENVPKVLTIHGLATERNGTSIEIQRRFLSFFNAFICVDRHLAALARGLGAPPGASFEYIPNSVDTRQFWPAPSRVAGPLRVGFVGRLEASRGLPYLWSLAERLPEGSELHAVLAASERQWIRSRRHIARPRIRVQINLSYNRMADFYRGIDVLFNPVEAPGISRATLEAMACGKPVIMLAIGDRQPVVHGVTGFLLNPDRCAAWDLITDLVGKHDQLLEMGRAARLRVEREFGNDVILPRILTVYKRLING